MFTKEEIDFLYWLRDAGACDARREFRCIPVDEESRAIIDALEERDVLRDCQPEASGGPLVVLTGRGMRLVQYLPENRKKPIPECLLWSNLGVKWTRFTNNPLEKAIAELWEKENEPGYERNLLQNILSKDDDEPAYVPENIREAIATVIQWLGSPVGKGFLDNVVGAYVASGEYGEEKPWRIP